MQEKEIKKPKKFHLQTNIYLKFLFKKTPNNSIKNYFLNKNINCNSFKRLINSHSFILFKHII